MDLSKKDKKILYVLDNNSRLSLSKISKKLRISKQSVKYNIDKLVSKKLISSFYTAIDISKLGLTISKIFLKLENTDIDVENKIKQYLINTKNVVWFSSCYGEYDIAFGIIYKKIYDLSDSLNNFYRDFSDYILDREMATIIKGQYYPRHYLNPNDKIYFRRFFYAYSGEVYKINDNEKKVLRELSKNPRQKIVEISRKTNLNVDTVRYIIKKLENEGIIRYYTFVPNEEVYPYLHYKVLLYLNDFSKSLEEKLEAFCEEDDNIVYSVKCMGQWDFEIDFEVESIDKLRNKLMQIKKVFSGKIRNYSILNILKVHKYNFYQ